MTHMVMVRAMHLLSSKHTCGLSLQVPLEKSLNRQSFTSTPSATAKTTNTFSRRYEFGYTPMGWVAPNREEPDLGWQRSLPKRRELPQRLLSNRSTYKTEMLRRSNQFTGNSQHVLSGLLDVKKTQTKPLLLDILPKQSKLPGKVDSG